jgi:hypothetical protein
MSEINVDVEKIKDEWSNLLFGVRRTIRYHGRRRKFFDSLSVWTNFLTIVCGGGAVVAAIKTETTIAAFAGGLAGVLAAFDLVVGFSTRARDHHDLCKEFSRLEREITASSVTAENLANLTNKRLEIEDDEPPTLRVLNNYCHNELCRAMGEDKLDYVKIGIAQSCCKQFFDFLPSTMEKHRDIEERKAKQSSKLASKRAPASAA